VALRLNDSNCPSGVVLGRGRKDGRYVDAAHGNGDGLAVRERTVRCGESDGIAACLCKSRRPVEQISRQARSMSGVLVHRISQDRYWHPVALRLNDSNCPSGVSLGTGVGKHGRYVDAAHGNVMVLLLESETVRCGESDE